MISIVGQHGGVMHQAETGVSLHFGNGSAASFTLTDGADGSGVAMAEKTVTSTSALPGLHWPDKIVQIKPERGDAARMCGLWRKVARPECVGRNAHRPRRQPYRTRCW